MVSALAPFHYGIPIREKHLSVVAFGQQPWDPIPRSTRSPDLSCINFFWDHMKSLVCEMLFPSVEDLIT
ncbi:hypothetical protein TNCV_2775271 [Trichonephila clavipes]|nr:hypothetical protein TNCV_2775271 [Trichonephila clavipes]